MGLQRQQSVILPEIGSKRFEEDENENDVIAAHDNSTDYYHGFRNRDGRKVVCTKRKVIL